MSTQLDPVTGAPLLTPDLGNIDQLPYKVQPVPLADQTNQPQLGRTYLYPDDVPPVLANLNAMNGTQPDQAQTVHTDGNHRLQVAVSGGGGGAPFPLPALGYGTTTQVIDAGGSNIFDFQAMAYVSGLGIAAGVWDWSTIPDTATHTNSVDFLLYNGWGLASIMLGGYKEGLFFAGVFADSLYIPFDPPIIPTGNDPDGAYPLAIEVVNNNVFTILASVSLVGLRA